MLSWNKLPSDVKNSESLDIFKSNLELFKSKTRALESLGVEITGKYLMRYWTVLKLEVT